MYCQMIIKDCASFFLFFINYFSAKQPAIVYHLMHTYIIVYIRFYMYDFIYMYFHAGAIPHLFHGIRAINVSQVLSLSLSLSPPVPPMVPLRFPLDEIRGFRAQIFKPRALQTLKRKCDGYDNCS